MPNPNSTHADLLKNLSITALNEMQVAAIAQADSGNNLVLIAPTGTGKTLAFLLSVYNKLSDTKQGLQALIVSPTRELALQTEHVFKSMKTQFRVVCCYGGHNMKIEQESLRTGPAVMIATPGRLADHIDRDSADVRTVAIVVLDEFDKSLEMGFHEQLKMLFRMLDGKQQHILTSATYPERLPAFLPFRNPVVIDFSPKSASPQKLIVNVVHTRQLNKEEALVRLVAGFNQEACLIFCNTREAVEQISTVFRQLRFEHGVFHGAMEQIDREKNLIKFRGGAHQVLIATDLAARGLDIPQIKHIVHYQLPPREEEFIHRNGRTARMHADGQSYLLLANDETFPEYVDKNIPNITLPGTLKLPSPPAYVCLYVSVGKQNKVSKGDIAGLFMKKANLQVDELGLITLLDHVSFVSVKRDKVAQVLRTLKNEKLKKEKVRIEIAE